MKLQNILTSKSSILLMTFVFVSLWGSFSQGFSQTPSPDNFGSAISVCELRNNRNKHKNKEVQVRGIFTVSAETSPLEDIGNCSDYDPVTAGPDADFERYNNPEMVA